MKRILSMVVILSMTLSFRAFCAPQNSFVASVATPDEMVTLIVELEETNVSSKGSVFSLFSDIDENTSAKDEVVAEICELSPESELPKFSYSEVFNGFSIDAPLSSANEIKKLDNVKNVYISRKIPMPELMMNSAGEISGAFAAQETGYSGEGQVIAVIDGFLDCEHEMFKEKPQNPALSKENVEKILNQTPLTIGDVSVDDVYYSEKIPFVYNYVEKTANVYNSEEKHGTHVSAIAVGKNGKLADGTLFSGVAPDAQLIFMNVAYIEENHRYLDSASILAAIDDSVKLGADVINLSLGVDFANGLSSAEKVAIDAARSNGILVSCAAGNVGKKDFFEKSLTPVNVDCPSISSPAVYKSAFSVASADTTNAKIDKKDTSYVCSTSSWGTYDLLRLKPEISAPGVNIYSAIPNGYTKASGTSMATPHISGIYALLNQYYQTNPFKAEYNAYTGDKKISFFENILMSSAYVMRNSEGTPFSPRHQGAGLVDISKATNAKAIIYGTDNRAQLALGENLTKNINLSFKIINISDEEIVFDTTTFDVTTDGYELSNGEKILNGTLPLTITEKSVKEEVITIASGGEYDFSATITLDENELDENSKIFTNGFFIDGFVTLSDSANNISAVSVPFFGFYGDWDKAPVFDKTMYDAEGSTITASEIGTSLIIFRDTGDAYFMGVNDYNADILNKKFISFSNGESSLMSGLPALVAGTYRRLESADFILENESGNVVFKETMKAQPKVFEPYIMYVTDEENFSKIPDGEYTLNVKGTLVGQNENTIDSLSLPFAVDSRPPEIIAINYNETEKTITFSAKDDHYLQAMYFYYPLLDGNDYFATFSTDDTTKKGEKITATFYLGSNPPDPSQIRIGCTDYARNDLDISLESVLMDIEVYPQSFSVASNSASHSFVLKNTTNSDFWGVYAAGYYDENGKLLGLCSTAESQMVEKGKTKTIDFTVSGDLTNAKTATVFILNSLSDLKPLERSYSYYLK